MRRSSRAPRELAARSVAPPSRRWRPVTSILVALLLAAGLGACDDAGTGARRALAERFVGRAVAESGAPAGPGRDALLAGRGWDEGLLGAAREGGGLRWDAQVRYRAAAPERVATLAVEARLDLRPDGAFHMRMAQGYETPDGRRGETGREAWWLDRLLYTRRANGPAFVRQSLDREHVRWRAAPVAAAGDLLHALAPFVALTPVDGDPRRYRIGPAPTPPAAAPGAERDGLRDRDDTWPRWFASLYAADAVSGELTLREDGRAVEQVRLSFEGRSRDGGTPITIAIRVEGRLTPLPAAEARWTPPEGARSPARERTHARIERILAPFRPAE